MPSFLQHLDRGITVIDTGFTRPRFDASYLIVENGRAAFVDTGPNSAVPRLLAALDERSIPPESVDWVIATHVHLDHAGGVGALIAKLPNAKLAIHPRGARHMIDPTQLMDGVRGVYGAEAANRDYGELVPVPEHRIVTTTDEMTIELAGRTLRFIHTPGHAKHHHCIWDAATRGWFTGDTFGIVYPELMTPAGPYILPATAPTQFDPEPLRASVARLLAQQPEFMYLTHFGPVTAAAKLSVQFLAQIDAMVAAARKLADSPDRHARLKQALADIYLSELGRMGTTLSPDTQVQLLSTDIDLNAQGLGAWLSTRAAR
jgi:glyoxylase-like metal-dependent hydrolase (beta-lactamase superfamily II)